MADNTQEIVVTDGLKAQDTRHKGQGTGDVRFEPRSLCLVPFPLIISP